MTTYIIESRYEYWSMYEGKIWTKWFKVHGSYYDNEDDAKEELKQIEKKSKEIDKVTKLKHEFRLVKNENR